MQEFNLRAPLALEADSAIQDKIELYLGEWIIHSIDDFISGFIGHLGRDDRSESNNPYRAFQNSQDIIFTGSYRFIKTLSGDITRNRNTPIFSGKLKISRRPNSYFKLGLYLSINPTRFCNYQHPLIRVRSNPSRHLSPHINLFHREKIIRAGDEFSLDQKDNVLFTINQKHNAAAGFYEPNLRRYIQSIINYIDSELYEYRDYCRLPSTISFDEIYSIKKIENYWEFADSTPIEKIRMLEPYFRSISSNSLVSEYPNIHVETQYSSLGLRCDIRSGERLKIYAKTNKRIRIEVEHNYSKNVNLTENRSVTANSIDQLIRFIHHSQRESSQSASQFIHCLRGLVRQSNILELSPFKYIASFYRAVGDIQLAEELLGLLRSHGGIPRRMLSEDMLQVMERVKSCGLVQYYSRPIYRYVIPPRYLNRIEENPLISE